MPNLYQVVVTKLFDLYEDLLSTVAITWSPDELDYNTSFAYDREINSDHVEN